MTHHDLKHQKVEEMRQYIGCNVTVVMDWGNLDAEANGVLKRVDEDGTAQVTDDAGLDHYVWPCLAVVPRGERADVRA